MNNIPIILAIDDNVVIPCGVTIASLLANAKADTFYDIHILYDVKALSRSNRELLTVSFADSKQGCVTFDEVRHFYYNGQNCGCGYTKGRCAQLANGELCGFLDPDDALAPNALEVMVDAHQNHLECSLIYSTCYRYFGDKTVDLEIWDYVGEIPEYSDFLIYHKKLVSHFNTLLIYNSNHI